MAALTLNQRARRLDGAALRVQGTRRGRAGNAQGTRRPLQRAEALRGRSRRSLPRGDEI